ncbi:hypothetical protein [Aureispira sp. CCB-E]|uniref:hypothetical protein n=1 Tax=Aureispira sp. CCB-E TaxID=3051121 RepID=UPI002868859A|nr:hypothetical protein [Aureispira sp. CCB-E]WMX17467.1 hypothetical protein QP953_13885 [Aureispira sp. CCB-E]
MEYNQLAKAIHQDQINAGWYDDYRSDNTLILLIKSELFEAFEAYRKESKIKALGQKYLGLLLYMSQEDEALFIERFKNNVKDSFADELADTVIRLLDFAGYKKMNLWAKNERPILFDSLLPYLIALDLQLTKFYSEFSKDSISSIIFDIENLANLYKIDLEAHIKLKLAYNKTRGKRHGNKAV